MGIAVLIRWWRPGLVFLFSFGSLGLLPALGCYLLAKVAEVFDLEVYAFSRGAFGGHALKHLLAAAACGVVLWMLNRREKAFLSR